MYIPFYLMLFFALELIYFKLAKRFNITDVPNHRSSHDTIIIRGGGVIFPLGLIVNAGLSGFDYQYFILGLLIISTVSFYDDFKPLSSKVRILCHLLAVSLMFYELGLFGQYLIVIISAYIIVIGTINAYNFMDGINGITVAYSLVAIISLLFINETIINFIKTDFLVALTVALVVFGFFNFRRLAVCFAGDVGSVSVAFILLYALLALMLATGELKYIGLFLVYGLDTVTTIIFRLIRRENIFEAHRTHFYQYLVNARRWPHILAASIYALIQLAVNIIIIEFSISWGELVWGILISGLIVATFRIWIEGADNILKPNEDRLGG